MTLDGNLTSGPGTNNTFISYTYDARNRLVGTLSTASVTYRYDPAGHRTAITNGASVTTFVINPNAALSQVLMRIKPGVTNYYIYGLGLLYEITETASSTTTLTYHYDYRGSTIALTDGTGNVTDRAEYSAYGSLTYRSGTSDTPFWFNGRYGVQTDANGLLCMRARYYNPYLCRFLNPDPLGFGGGLNWYAYADGNPVSCLIPLDWERRKRIGLVEGGCVPIGCLLGRAGTSGMEQRVRVGAARQLWDGRGIYCANGRRTIVVCGNVWSIRRRDASDADDTNCLEPA